MRTSDTLDSILSKARELLSIAEQEGAEEAEVYGTMGRSVDVDLRRDSVELASESFHMGLGLRAVVSGAVGFSCTSDMSLLNSVAKSAVSSARARGPDPSWRSLPLPQSVVHPEGVFDPRLAEFGPEDCIEFALDMLSGARRVEGAEPVSGGVAAACGSSFVLNSNGIELQETGTIIQASMEAISRVSGVATGSEFYIGRFRPAALDGVGEAASRMAVASAGGSQAESGLFDVLLRPMAFAELLEGTLLSALSSDSVQKGRSSLAARIGECIADERLIIEDDGLLAGGIDSSAFDGEGTPSRRTRLLDQGVLRGYLYDCYTAGKEGGQSTGNAVRSGYTDLPRVGIRNLIVTSTDTRDLLRETRGYMVHGLIGAHTANPISGDFSVEARNAFWIAPGEEPRPVRSLMLAGNIFEILKDIAVGSDVRAVGSIVTPTVRVRMKVVGS